MVNTPFPNSVKGCPLALASILDFCKVGLLESGILWPQHKILVTEEIVNRDTSTPSPKFVVGRQVIKSDGVYVEGAIQGMTMTDAGNLGFIQQYNSFSQFYISGPSFTFHKNI
jgi:hypothetical protein